MLYFFGRLSREENKVVKGARQPDVNFHFKELVVLAGVGQHIIVVLPRSGRPDMWTQLPMCRYEVWTPA